MPSQLARSAFNVILEVNGVRFRVMEVRATFALNRIPTCQCVLAIGMDASSLDPAKVHTHGNVFTKMSRALVYLDPRGQWEPDDEGFPQGEGRWDEAGPQVIFDGYVTGAGYVRQHGKISYAIGLTHWLCDLDFASILSGQSHPGNPARYRWRSVFTGEACGDGGDRVGMQPFFLSQFVSQTLITSQTLRQDLWGAAWFKILWSLSTHDVLRLAQPGLDQCAGFAGVESNEQALNALKRIETREADEEEPSQADCVGAGSPYWVPLSMKLDGGASDLIGQAIAEAGMKQTVDALWSTTIWDKVVSELGSEYFFSIVPKILTAQVVPFVPGLRDVWEKELDLRDITYIDTKAAIPRPLRAVGILSSGLASRTNAAQAATAPMQHLGGCWSPGPDTQGMILFRSPPSWLSMVPAQIDLAPEVLENGPDEFDPEGEEPDGEEPGRIFNASQAYYTDLAHTHYAMNMLRGRYAQIQGKLRFDIAPGSTCFIRNPKPLFLEEDLLTNNLVGSVSRVTYYLNAEERRAGTTFQLEYVRTEQENEDDATSLTKHPMYNTTFTGAPLLHAYKFPA